MGCAGSKHNGNEALFLCKERVRFIRQAMDSRYALSAAQLSYTQSLRNVGVALRQFAECQNHLVESPLSTSEPDKSPSHSSYASPSPSRLPENVASPRNSGSPLSPHPLNMSYMKAAQSSPLKFTVDSSNSHFVEEESLTFPFPPPPPPPLPDSSFSWDFFDASDANGNSRSTNGGSGINQTFSRLVGLNSAKEEGMPTIVEEEVRPSQPIEYKWAKANTNGGASNKDLREKESVGASGQKAENGNVDESVEDQPRPKKEKDEEEKEVCAPREDASKFITHRAKAFVSSVKDIEHRFNKAAESGHEVSRMLETKKIRLSISSETIGKPSDSVFLSVILPTCCKGGKGGVGTDHGTALNVTKVITWNRSVSSRSSSSRNPLTSASKDDCGDSGSDFIEEFCMISGSHASTLDRLYAWERKLYDEVKASESVRRAYDNKCNQLRHQFAKDMSAQVIDKTRATVKDLHSRVRVAIQAVDSISRRIEKLRDEELQPQILELIQGLIRMWKAMLECHHAQYITISLAYQMKSLATTLQQTESYRHAVRNLQNEIECFTSSFESWTGAQRSYVEALNSWLQKCILPPQERSWRRRVPFSPRRALAPPIFVLAADWLAGINSLPSDEVIDSLKALELNLRDFLEQQKEEKPEVVINSEPEQEKNAEEKCESDASFAILKVSLTRLFDQMTKFSEALVKVYENVKEGTEKASTAYVNGGRFRYQQGLDTFCL